MSPRQHGPSACGLCGIEKRGHGRQYTEGAGWHIWKAPTQAQILARMSTRRTRRSTVTTLHSTVRFTDELRATAEGLRDLGADEITATDDPLTVFRNLHAALDAIRDAWPALSGSAGFEDPYRQEDVTFTDDIKRGLQLAVDGLWVASNSI